MSIIHTLFHYLGLTEVLLSNFKSIIYFVFILNKEPRLFLSSKQTDITRTGFQIRLSWNGLRGMPNYPQ